jgi:hypothetical protein
VTYSSPLDLAGQGRRERRALRTDLGDEQRLIEVWNKTLRTRA